MLAKGKILVSEPFLGDSNFERSVILLCDHSEESSFGFVLNKPSIISLDSVIAGVKNYSDSIYVGGPVGQDTLHFIHRHDFALEGDREIAENVYWGGNFDQVKRLLLKNEIPSEDIRFFLGYSGWGEGQLQAEISQSSWIIGDATAEDLFDVPPEELWRVILKNMGGKYKMFANYPIDPRLN
ncbi:MAG TPA: YqgE/AlgH family protein [Cytophagaceae bacterium]|jgi:putative transcriptional regulator